ncbi:MAG: lipopolysaccharide kinase InaA family protein [Myxococcota bacterium]
MRDGVRWEIDGLCAEDAKSVFAWVSGTDGPGEIVNESRARRVVRLPGASGDLYLKHDRVRGIWPRLRFAIAPSRARAEWEMARRLSGLKIPTVRPLALGERRRFGLPADSWLVTEGIQDAQSLDALLRAREAPVGGLPGGRWRRDLARALGHVVSAFHREGFCHRDLHPGNFLVQSVGEPGLRVWLIDLQKAGDAGGAAGRARITDLAWLDYGARLRVFRTDRLRFLRAYLAEAPGGPVPWKGCARAVLAASHARAKRHWKRREKRALRGGPHFVRERVAGGTLHRAEGVPRDQMLDVIARAEGAAGPDVLRETRRARVVRVRRPSGERYCVKRYRRAAGWALYRRDRARAAWRAAEGCRLRGVATPRALALLEPGRGGGASSFVMEDLGVLPWLTHHAALTLRGAGVPRSRRSAFARAVGGWLRHLHGQGVRHGDLKAGNILVDARPGGWRFVLLDLEDVDFPARIPPEDRERALVQLCGSLPPQVSATDRLRAFRAYAAGGTLGDARETRRALGRIVRRSIARRHLWGPEARPWVPEPEGYGEGTGPPAGGA